ncbi:MAG: FlgD immunoglobulin-like domain containing protein [Candidatus Cloacimonas sp.]
MYKKLLILSVILLWAIVLVGATITLNYVGIKGPSSNPVIPGQTVYIKVEYTLSGFNSEFGIVNGVCASTSGPYDKARIYWYSSSDGTGSYLSFTDVTATQINRTGITDNAYTDEVQITLPTYTGANSFKIRVRVYGDDGEGNTITSGLVISTGHFTGYSAYLQINTNTAPYATNVIITNPLYAKVGQTIYGDYDYNDDTFNEESGTILHWLRSDSQSGTYTEIDGATSKTYTVVQDDLGKYLKFEVTPKNGVEPGTGATVLSDPTGPVTGTPRIEFNASYKTITETTDNDGSVSSDTYLRIDAVNTSFNTGISVSDIISVQNLPEGLHIASLVCENVSYIDVYLSGRATYHEYAAIVSNFKITVDDAKLVGVSGDKQTTNSCTINFTNNPPKNLALNSVGNNYVKITWVKPDGLKSSGSGLRNFYIYRNNSYWTSVSPTTYSYTDNSVSNGTQYTYKVMAEYINGTDETTEDIILATPLAITAFSFSSPSATGTIDHINKTIKVVVPNDTNVTNLVANFTAPGATVKVGTATQTSGTTANNFTNPVTYILTTSSDASTCSYVVTVYKMLATPTTQDGNITTSSIQAKWGSVSGVSNYLLDVSTNSGFSSFLPGYHDTSITSTSCTINGLNYNTTYYYRVKAVASDPDLNSNYSTTKSVTTNNVSAGTGSTEINSSEETTINVGDYVSGHGTVTPTVKVHPTSFSPSDNDIINVSMGYGTVVPQGLIYTLAFANHTIGNGTFTLSYSGLYYDPKDIGYILDDGELHSIGVLGVNTTNKTITFTMSGLTKGSKSAHTLKIITNDGSDQTLPVVLSSFTATLMVQGKVRLDWVTQSASGLTGFRVLRNTVAEVSSAVVVSSLIEANNTSTAVSYSFIDNEIPCNGTYYYWLQIEEQDGYVSYSASAAVEVTNGDNPDIPIPLITALNKPFPNPFNPSLTIPFDLSKDGRVTIKIYNLKGQLIKNLVDEDKKASNYRIVWDGKDNSGHIVSAGTYLVRMNATDYQSSCKIVMVK